jgi:hypothetical protein
VLAQIPDVIETRRLKLGAEVVISGTAASLRISSVTSSTALSATSWMKLRLAYSPDEMREMTSRRVISGSTMASRPRLP